MQSASCKMPDWMNHTGIKTARRNINNFRYADDTTLITESKEELKNLLMRIKEESEKTGLKLNIQKTKIMAYTPSLQGKWKEKKWKQGQILFPWAPKLLRTVTTAMKLKDACSLERNPWQTRQRIKEQRHHFANKSLHSQSCGFSSSHVDVRGSF